MPSPFSTVGKLFRRFRRNRGGSAAVEFALVAPIFFALLFAIIESAMVFFASQLLETVTADSARLVMTGQAQTAATTQSPPSPGSSAKKRGSTNGGTTTNSCRIITPPSAPGSKAA